MQLVTLGGLRLEGAAFTRPKPLLLLTYLTLEGPRDRRHLSNLFWPTASSPMTNLRTALSQLRLGAPDSIEVRGPRIESLIESDAGALLSRIDRGELGAVQRLYSGPFLDGFYLPDWSWELEEWVYSTREHLTDSVREAMLRLAEHEAADGDFGEAAKRAEAAYGIAGASEPDSETVERLYRLLVAAESPRVAGLQREAAEYGIELTASPAEAQRALRTSQRHARDGLVPNNLPARGTSFVGREEELAELSGLLADTPARLITLTGPGGMGKTHLALEFAHRALRRPNFEDGVYIVELESLSDPDLVPSAIGSAIGAAPERSESWTALAKNIGSKRVLLVLDNCEHVIDGLGAIPGLLSRCPCLAIVATSRLRLGFEEEQLFAVPGLSFPAVTTRLEEAPTGEALRLFVQRAKRVQYDFALTGENLPAVAEICRLVAGSPLAVELAAACVRFMSVSAIAGELREGIDLLSTDLANVPERHRSMRSALEHSWKLLSAKEEGVMKALAVFSGGFTREAAAAVADASIPVLARLVDKSLLHTLPGGRYELHPLLHQFAAERLGRDPDVEQEVRQRHTDFYLDMVERARAELRGKDQPAWLDRLEDEHDNLRAILRRSNALAEWGTSVRLAAALWQFWQTRGHWTEGRAWLEAAISCLRTNQEFMRSVAPDVLDALAESQRGLAVLASAQGDNHAALSSFAESLALSERLGNNERVAALLNNIGVLALHQGEYEKAESDLARALAMRRQMNDSWGVAATLNNLGAIAGKQGDVERAQGYYAESLDLFRALGNDSAVALLTSNLGDVAEFQGEWERAKAYFAESLALHRKLEDRAGVAASLTRLAAIARRKADTVRARSLCKESLEYLSQLKDNERTAECLNEVALILASEGQPEGAARLWGAMEELLEVSGVPLTAGQASEYSEAATSVEAQLGEVGFEMARASGKILTFHEAIAAAVAACLRADPPRSFGDGGIYRESSDRS